MIWGKCRLSGRRPAHSVRIALLLLAVIPGLLAAQLPDRPQRIYTRQDLWFSAGLGYGGGDGGSTGGLGANLAIGWTLSPQLSLAVGTTDLRGPHDRTSVTVGTLDLRLQFYPEVTGGFFLTGGLGLGFVHLGDSGTGADIGRGIVIGLGYDARIAENVSITTFVNGFDVHTPDPRCHAGIIGVGLTFH